MARFCTLKHGVNPLLKKIVAILETKQKPGMEIFSAAHIK